MYYRYHKKDILYSCNTTKQIINHYISIFRHYAQCWETDYIIVQILGIPTGDYQRFQS
jgi:hypothetical protein